MMLSHTPPTQQLPVRGPAPAVRPRMARDAAVRALKRQIIVDAARTVFAEAGLEGTSMRGIAAAAGCTTGAIYPYFRNKEELYAAVLSDSLNSLRLHIEDAVGRASEPRARVATAIRSYFAYYRSRPDDLTLGLYLYHGLKPAGLTPELDRKLNRRLAQVLDVIGDAIAAYGGLDAEARRMEICQTFSYVMGLLICDCTHRLNALGGSAEPLLERYTQDLLARLAP
ncbi:TetR/AcrR family transcriptional regulator [Tistrella sp. BH-R2-4]|uniref:TetR/AcrR family transcriptional regulator n=1 Tax=Tistrella arctica TaxID=3133430 RepID=A0ABU9YFW8_9PROT